LDLCFNNVGLISEGLTSTFISRNR